ncbi:hypothetical protein M0805_002795 [Coniferiporia weirii]|nr:hypothetical protein M0805_002795 [Coniferiporia weirii]
MKLAVVLTSAFFFGKGARNRHDLEGGDCRLTMPMTDRKPTQIPGGVSEGSLSNDENDEDVLNGDEELCGPPGPAESSVTAGGTPHFRPGLCTRVRKKFITIKNFVLQTDGDGSDDSEHPENHRLLPIISGIVIPFSILLEIPGLTEHWYIITENNATVFSRKNSALLDVGLSISMTCALIANIAIISRFLEKKVRTSTLIAIVALSIHDIINIVAVTIFGVIHRFNDGFTYGQSFWFTVCSTVASVVTNATLIVDYVRTPDFARSSSGLSRRQRSLVIVVMILLVWIALGSLVNSLLMDLSFIDGMYYTVVVIETIGFGDIVPRTTGARVFTALHGTIGILNLALAIGICRDTVIEGFESSYRKQLNAFGERHKARVAHRREKRARKLVLKRQLERAGLPVYVHTDGQVPGIRRTHLNEEALTDDQRALAEREKEEILNQPDDLRVRRGTTISSLSIENELTEHLQKEFAVKLAVVWSLFLTFWLIGSAIFMATEGWSYGGAMWFCFESFSTIGFGETTPVTPTGRSIFIVWALLGVGAMTILISVLGEAYSSRYKKALQAHASRAIDEGEKKVANMFSKLASADDSEKSEPRASERPDRPLQRSGSCPNVLGRRTELSSLGSSRTNFEEKSVAEARAVRRDFGLKPPN